MQSRRRSKMGRSPKYYFLIDRLEDHRWYCAATIARLLTSQDLEQLDVAGTLDQVRTKARMSLARAARCHPLPPSSIVYLGKGQSGNAYPGYRGSEWKEMFQRDANQSVRKTNPSIYPSKVQA